MIMCRYFYYCETRLKESTVWKLTLNSLALFLLSLRRSQRGKKRRKAKGKKKGLYKGREESTRVQRFTPVSQMMRKKKEEEEENSFFKGRIS